MSTTESESLYKDLDRMSTRTILESINREDSRVPVAVATAMQAIEALVDAVTDRLLAGGRLFYIGAGTSGRLGIVDASECPPTYGVPPGLVIGLIAGGDGAVRTSVEHAEDDTEQGWLDLAAHDISGKDFVIGIAASGRMPYVVGALKKSRQNHIATGCIVCNQNSAVAAQADYPIEVIVGPEFVTGSTRMKAGTAQKLVLNMISTSVMIKIGRVQGNRMVNMQLSNDKLIERGTAMVSSATGLDEKRAKKLLLEAGSVKNAIDEYNKSDW